MDHDTKMPVVVKLRKIILIKKSLFFYHLFLQKSSIFLRKSRISFSFPSRPAAVWICVYTVGEALRLCVCRYQGCFSVVFLGLSLIDLCFQLRFLSLLPSVHSQAAAFPAFFICFFRHLHHLFFQSYKNHYSSHTNTHSHSSRIRTSCRQENKSLICLNGL